MRCQRCDQRLGDCRCVTDDEARAKAYDAETRLSHLANKATAQKDWDAARIMIDAVEAMQWYREREHLSDDSAN